MAVAPGKHGRHQLWGFDTEEDNFFGEQSLPHHLTLPIRAGSSALLKPSNSTVPLEARF